MRTSYLVDASAMVTSEDSISLGTAPSFVSWNCVGLDAVKPSRCDDSCLIETAASESSAATTATATSAAGAFSMT